MTAKELIGTLNLLVDEFGNLEVTTEGGSVNHVLENGGTFILTE